MKMQFKSMLLLLGVSFFIFAGFKNADQRSVKGTHFKDQPTPVTIESIYTSRAADGTVMGTFTAHGGIETTGWVEMDVHRYANVAHCSQTFHSAEGTFTALSNCQFSTMEGTWRIVEATGAYSDLEGNGKLLMTFPGPPVFVHESWSGKVR